MTIYASIQLVELPSTRVSNCSGRGTCNYANPCFCCMKKWTTDQCANVWEKAQFNSDECYVPDASRYIRVCREYGIFAHFHDTSGKKYNKIELRNLKFQIWHGGDTVTIYECATCRTAYNTNKLYVDNLKSFSGADIIRKIRHMVNSGDYVAIMLEAEFYYDGNVKKVSFYSGTYIEDCWTKSDFAVNEKITYTPDYNDRDDVRKVYYSECVKLVSEYYKIPMKVVVDRNYVQSVSISNNCKKYNRCVKGMEPTLYNDWKNGYDIWYIYSPKEGSDYFKCGGQRCYYMVMYSANVSALKPCYNNNVTAEILDVRYDMNTYRIEVDVKFTNLWTFDINIEVDVLVDGKRIIYGQDVSLPANQAKTVTFASGIILSEGQHTVEVRYYSPPLP